MGFRGAATFYAIAAIASLAVVAACSEAAPATGEAPRVDRSAVGPCREGDPDQERWGASCLCCHAESFGVAGSVAHDAGVAQVFIVDRDGKTAEMFVNPYDNFFQHRNLVAPLQAVIRFEDGTERAMRGPAPHGSCNACHGETVSRIGAR